MFNKIIFRFYLFLCLCCPFQVSSSEFDIITKQIPHIDNPKRLVEFYVLRPKLTEKLPVIIYVHGYQEDKMGAKKSIEGNTLPRFANEGYFVVAVSQPGFGKSSGPPDYSGPFSQRAVTTVIQYLKAEYSEFIDPNKIVLWGKSRGAIVISNLATYEKNLAALILDAGLYDMRTTTDKLTLKNLEKEAGSTPERIQERSALFSANKIIIPSLMLHGYKDDRAPIQQAIQFYEAIMKAGAKATLVIFPTGHHVPSIDRQILIRLFLKNLFEKKSVNFKTDKPLQKAA